MPKGNLRPPTPLPTRKEHMDKTYPANWRTDQISDIQMSNTQVFNSPNIAPRKGYYEDEYSKKPPTKAGGGGKKPPKKPPTKTGGTPDKPEEPKEPKKTHPYEREDREDRYKNGWYN